MIGTCTCLYLVAYSTYCTFSIVCKHFTAMKLYDIYTVYTQLRIYFINCKNAVLSCSIFIYLATKQMISTLPLTTGSDYIELNWTRPKFIPVKYLLHVQYTSFKNARKGCVKTNSQCLSSDTTSIKISDLRPKSVCVLILLAVYNPASIDSGIMITGKTLDAGTSKINHCLLDYHNKPQ